MRRALVGLLPVLLLLVVASACFEPEAKRSHVWALMLVPDPEAACVAEYALENYDGVRLDSSQDLQSLFGKLDNPELLQLFGQAAKSCSFDVSLAQESHWASWSRGVVKAMDGGMALGHPEWDETRRWCFGANLIRQHDPIPLNQMSEEARGELLDALAPNCPGDDE